MYHLFPRWAPFPCYYLFYVVYLLFVIPQVGPLPWAKKVTLLLAEPDIPYCDGENCYHCQEFLAVII